MDKTQPLCVREAVNEKQKMFVFTGEFGRVRPTN